MKKKTRIFVILAAVLFLILFVPIPSGPYKDGGSRAYTALTYKIVDWRRLSGDTVYEKTRFYLFPDNFKSIDELWDYKEADKVEYKFRATVLELNETTALVEPLEGEEERCSSDRISFEITMLDDIGVETGSIVEVTYNGDIMESYPAQISATKWRLSDDLREYTEQWLDKENAVKYDNTIFNDIVITQIYANCFFATTVIPMPYEIKVNADLSDNWCVGDQVSITYKNTYYDEKNQRVEVDMLSIAESDFELDPNACYKPVIYLYPERETQVSVHLTLDGRLTCTYPAYNEGWTVTAAPDGTLTTANGQTYSYLYWEGETLATYDLSKGFCVKGQDTAAFLEEILAKLGLTRREANEFIVYWLPKMQDNPYNLITFQTDAYTAHARLHISPEPDSLLRIFMVYQALQKPIPVEEPVIVPFTRNGFTVVEWGGTKVR